MTRPERLVVVTGTGTEVGKTWWTADVARGLRDRGTAVAARKPVQSYAPDDTTTDADVLAAATGVDPHTVCPSDRWLPMAMAPPIAAAALGRPVFTIGELVDSVAWPAPCAVGFVEGAGGVRSPLAADGDTVGLVRALAPDVVLVVAHAGLGVINGVRSALDALLPLEGGRAVVALNHYDGSDDVHLANRDWLVSRDGLDVVVDPGELVNRWA
jgi:dethiobiotin synthetase